MLDPIVKEIEVPCDQRTAFDVFVQDMATWWPFERFSVSALGGGTVKALRVEAREGGAIIEMGEDGREWRWGTFRTVAPHDYLAMDFHVDHPDHVTEAKTLVEVRFTPLAEDRTRVRLTQSNWEVLADMAEMARGGYGTAWTMILGERYAAACAA